MRDGLPNFVDTGARPDALQQLFDAQMQDKPAMDMSVDFRDDSPCRQAASELMVPGSFGADGQNLIGGFVNPATPSPPRVPHSPLASFPTSPLVAHPPLQPQCPNGHPQPFLLCQPWEALRRESPSTIPMPPYNQNFPPELPQQCPSGQGIPGFHPHPEPQHQRQEYMANIMRQAQGVGVWGPNNQQTQRQEPVKGTTHKRHPSQAVLQHEPAPPGGLENGARQAQQSASAQQNPIQFYQSEMESMLPPRAKQGNGLVLEPYQGQGHISRENQLFSQHPQMNQGQPRFQPVSLGMTSDTLSQILSQSQRQGMNDGPFRPPTKLLAKRLDGRALEPVNQQSRMQLSLGLASGSPINLDSWSYADDSMSTGVTYVGSGPPDFNGERQQASESSAHRTNSASAAACTSNPCSSSAGKRHQAEQMAMKSADFSLRSCKSLDMSEPRTREDISRAECLQRYQDKKRRRHLYKTIRYLKRKVNADNRPRFKGRFVKSLDLSKSEETTEKAEGKASGRREKPMSTATVAAGIGDNITHQETNGEAAMEADPLVDRPTGEQPSVQHAQGNNSGVSD